MTPALLTSTSIRACFSAIAEIACSASRGSFTSQGQVENWGVKTKQVSLCPLEFFLIARQEGDVRSVPGKFAGQGQAKTAGSPGNDHNFVSQ